MVHRIWVLGEGRDDRRKQIWRNFYSALRDTKWYSGWWLGERRINVSPSFRFFGGTCTVAKLYYCQVLLKIARQRRRRFRQLTHKKRHLLNCGLFVIRCRRRLRRSSKSSRRNVRIENRVRWWDRGRVRWKHRYYRVNYTWKWFENRFV